MPGFNSGNMVRGKSKLPLHLSWAQVGQTEYLGVQNYQNIHPCDSGSDLQAAVRKLSRKSTANIPRSKVSLPLQIFDFVGNARITKIHLLDSKVLAQQLSVPSPRRALHIQIQRRVSVSSSQHFHWIFTYMLRIPPQAQESLFLCEPSLCATQSIALLCFQLSGSWWAEDEGFFTTAVPMCQYQGGTAVTSAVLAKSSGLVYTVNPLPGPEEGNYFFYVCINI